MTQKHKCHARDCTKTVRPDLLMCRAHWTALPRRIRDEIWRTYRAGQEIDKNPSAEWLAAADAAIGFIARMEGRKLRRAEQTALIDLRLD